MPLCNVSLDELTIVDEASFAHVAVYGQLKRMLCLDAPQFRVAAPGTELSWDRATFLNLTFWNTADSADVLCERVIPADVIAHIAWHHIAAPQLARLAPDATAAPTAVALFFSEAIASAFDLYLVGRLLRNVPDSDFIETQVSIMCEVAEARGRSEGEVTKMLELVADDPERAFEDLRTLLFDVTRALFACRDAVAAQQALERFEDHRFESLLHHYQLSNWVLYARAYGEASPEQDRAILELDVTLRAAPVALDWLIEHWMQPAR
jgi:hypothetical protein